MVCADGYTSALAAGHGVSPKVPQVSSIIQIATGIFLTMQYNYDGGAAVAPGRGAVPAGAGPGVRVARGARRGPAAIRPSKIDSQMLQAHRALLVAVLQECEARHAVADDKALGVLVPLVLVCCS